MKVMPQLLILLVFAVAVGATTIDYTPLVIYETNTHSGRIEINNSGGPATITGVQVGTNNLEVTGASNYTEWTTTYDTDTVEWTGGTVETNVEQAIFRFTVKAGKITADEKGEVEIDLDGVTMTGNRRTQLVHSTQ